MGNGPSKTTKGWNKLDSIPNRNMTKKFNHPYYGEVKYIKDPDTDQQILLKEVLFTDKQSFQKELDICNKRTIITHPNVVRVLGTSIHNQPDSSTTDEQVFSISIMIEYIPRNLFKEFYGRQESGKPYNENELLFITENLISALAYFQSHNIYHGDIRHETVFVAKDDYKLSDPCLSAFCNANALYNAIKGTERAFVSPQMLRQVGERDFEMRCDKYKSDVFSLGVTLLSLATLTNSEELYDYETATFNMDAMRQRLEHVRQSYSIFTYELIRDMLRITEGARPDFIALAGKIQPYQEEIRKKVPLRFFGVKAPYQEIDESDSDVHNPSLSQNIYVYQNILKEEKSKRKAARGRQYNPERRYDDLRTEPSYNDGEVIIQYGSSNTVALQNRSKSVKNLHEDQPLIVSNEVPRRNLAVNTEPDQALITERSPLVRFRDLSVDPNPQVISPAPMVSSPLFAESLPTEFAVPQVTLARNQLPSTQASTPLQSCKSMPFLVPLKAYDSNRINNYAVPPTIVHPEVVRAQQPQQVPVDELALKVKAALEASRSNYHHTPHRVVGVPVPMPHENRFVRNINPNQYAPAIVHNSKYPTYQNNYVNMPPPLVQNVHQVKRPNLAIAINNENSNIAFPHLVTPSGFNPLISPSNNVMYLTPRGMEHCETAATINTVPLSKRTDYDQSTLVTYPSEMPDERVSYVLEKFSTARSRSPERGPIFISEPKAHEVISVGNPVAAPVYVDSQPMTPGELWLQGITGTSYN